MNGGLANSIAKGQAQRDVEVDDQEEGQRLSTEVDCHGGPLSEVFGPPESEEQQRATTEMAAMVGLFPKCPDPRRQPHRWQKGGSLYRNATSDGCNRLAGPSHRPLLISRTRHLRSGFDRTRWRCRCSPCRRGSGSSHRSIRQYLQRRDRSSRHRRQWHLLQQHLWLQR